MCVILARIAIVAFGLDRDIIGLIVRAAAQLVVIIRIDVIVAVLVAFSEFLSELHLKRFGFAKHFTVSDRDLVVVGVDFAERQKAMAVATILDEGCLEARFDPRHASQINVSA